jgi:hypothetical protein
MEVLMNEVLLATLHELARMKYPSVAEILRRYGYEYESLVVQKIIDEYEKEVETTQK